MSCEDEARGLEQAQSELATARQRYQAAEDALERAKSLTREDDEDDGPAPSTQEAIDSAEEGLDQAAADLQAKDKAASAAENALNDCLARSRDGDGCGPAGCLRSASGCGVRGGALLVLAAGVALVAGGIWMGLQPPPPQTPPGPPPLTVGPIKSTFDYPSATTTYTVTASSATGRPLTYTWDKDNQRECGKFQKGPGGPTDAWTHPDKDRRPPGDCPSENHHPGTITVVVSDGSVSCKAEFPYGSDADTGLQPKCPSGSPGGTVARSWWEFELFGLDYRWDPWILDGAGLLLILVAGFVLFLGELGRDGCLPELIYKAARRLGLI